MHTVRFRRTIRPPWMEVPAIALGAPPGARGTPDLYALVSRASAPELRLDLYAGDQQAHVAQQALFAGDVLLVGFGECVFVVGPAGADGRAVRELRLSSYFVGFHRAADAVYVASGEDVTRLDLEGRLVWTSPQLAAGGVRVELVTDEHVVGEAEHEPAGDWRPFRIAVADGRPA